MAQLRECDQCKSQTLRDRVNGWVRVQRSHLGIVTGSTPPYELCPSCERSLARWLEEAPSKGDR